MRRIDTNTVSCSVNAGTGRLAPGIGLACKSEYGKRIPEPSRQVVLIRSRDYRLLLAVARAADEWNRGERTDIPYLGNLEHALDRLNAKPRKQ